MNRYELFAAMIARTKVTLTRFIDQKITGLIQGIQVEDGSGHRFIITLCDDTNNVHTIYLDDHQYSEFRSTHNWQR